MADPQVEAKFEKAFADTDLPSLYANGFGMALTNADVLLMLELRNRPIAMVHMSFTLAKTLQTKLTELIDKFESKTGQTLLITTDVDRVLGDSRPKKDKTEGTS